MPTILVTVFLGTVWSSIKEVKVPFWFDWERGIALHAMQGNRASSHSEGEVAWFFPSCGANMGYWEGHIGILLKSCQGNRDAS